MTDLDGVTAVFDALLRIAEIEAGTRRSAFADIDLAPVLAELAELYTAPAEERGLALAFDAPDSLPIHGDRDLIGQAVVNLLDNALKFSPPGGAVRLHAARVAGLGAVSVQDGGPGIPSATAAGRRSGSFAANRPATRPAPAWAWRWWTRWRSCMAAA